MISSAKLSQFSLIFFLSLTIIAALISELFQAPLDTTKSFSDLQFLFREKNISQSNQISLKNKLGTFIFKIVNDEGTNTKAWQMISPRNLPVNQNLLNDLLQSIENLKIQKVFQQDIINVTNFSLDNPQATITLFQNIKEEIIDENNSDNNDSPNGTTAIKSKPTSVEVKIGLINPLNNYTYISTDLHEAIYEIDGLNKPFHSLGLLDFIESKIFLVQKKDIKKIQVLRGSNKNFSLELAMDPNNKWLIGNKKEANNDNVQDYLNYIVNYKSQIIIDKQTPELKDKLSSYFAKPYAKMFITTQDDKVVTFTFTNPIYYLPGINIEKGQSIIIKSSDYKFPVIANKNIIYEMFKSNRHFTKLEFKKLFY